VIAAKRNLALKRVLVTGVSSGIGRALAIALSREKARLILTARRKDRLTDLAEFIEQQGGQVCFVAGDITDAELRSRLLKTASQKYGGLDVLINNAGVGGMGTFASTDEARLRRIMEVNFFAPAELMRSSLPLLRQSSDAVVVNVGSVLGHFAVPEKSEYCASKFALHGLTDAVRMELAEEGIDVQLISPSTTRSEFFDRALRSAGDVASKERGMFPEQVANQIIHAIKNRRREIILSFGGKTLAWADRLFPGIMSRVLQRYG